MDRSVTLKRLARPEVVGFDLDVGHLHFHQAADGAYHLAHSGEHVGHVPLHVLLIGGIHEHHFLAAIEHQEVGAFAAEGVGAGLRPGFENVDSAVAAGEGSLPPHHHGFLVPGAVAL